MLASRIDQENLLHERATSAAGKPLNGNKTPGHKSANPNTPFRVPLNDENAVVRGGPAGKSVLKTGVKGENVATVGKKLLNSAFVTPAGPRNRQALGAKTTNAKANVRLEQSPLKTVQQSGSPRLRRPKIKVLPTEEIQQVQEDDRDDVEYMAPRGDPLFDFPIDSEFPLTKEFPQLRPENLTKGWASAYLNANGRGVERLERERSERKSRQAAISETQLNSTMESVFSEIDASVRLDLGLPMKQAVTKKSTAAAKTILSKSAASALSKQRTAAPSIRGASSMITSQKIPSGSSAQQRLQESLTASKKQQKEATLPITSSRVPSSVSASHSTLGYARGRAVSSRVVPDRKPAAQNVFGNARRVDLKKTDVSFDRAVREVVDGLRNNNLDDARDAESENDEDEDDMGMGSGFPNALELDEEWDGFELPMPMQPSTGGG